MRDNCAHEEAKVWRWDVAPRGIAYGWNWCEGCGALVKVEKREVVVITGVVLPNSAKPLTPSQTEEAGT